MTQPDEPTVASAPQKAHGDALEDVVNAPAESPDNSPADGAEADRDG